MISQHPDRQIPGGLFLQRYLECPNEENFIYTFWINYYMCLPR